MVRGNWENLNGLWEYAITAKDITIPSSFDGKILVPFPLESALSGVKKTLKADQYLWYRRSFARPVLKTSDRVLLHFGAVDWQATVWMNGKEVGTHTGGYTGFSMDVTDFVKTGQNEVLVRVFDPSDQGIGPHGKQVMEPKGIMYTPSSGIWQTVWLEVVPEVSIKELKLTPDLDKKTINIGSAVPSGYSLEAMAFASGKQVGSASGSGNLEITIPNVRPWSPENPFLYDLVVRLKKDGKIVDEVKSYFGMRKIAIAKDDKGVDRIFLNNKVYFNLGTLDQGFWPDGLYTAPSDEALAFDIRAIKAMGFNTIRKHIKVEPMRWYYWADKLGVLVWQDFVNPNQRLAPGAKEAFEKEGAEMLAQLQNVPSITTWVLFNERWGQYDQQRLTNWVKKSDPSRLVNGHSGEILYVNEKLRAPAKNPYVDADMTDIHAYPEPMNAMKLAGKAQVVGEFGGIGVTVPGHQWTDLKGWGYVTVSPAQFEGRYAAMVQSLKIFEEQGMSASIYTQPFDVEGEENGLMTYDREIVKIPFFNLREIHRLLAPSTTARTIVAKDMDIKDEGMQYFADFTAYRNGKKDKVFLRKLLMASVRMNDKTGGKVIITDFVNSLNQGVLDHDGISVVLHFVKSSEDPGYDFVRANEKAIGDIIGKREVHRALMGMVLKGVIEPLIGEHTEPDWEKIEMEAMKHGAAGDEVYFRARTFHHLNNQQWLDFVPVGRRYLERYGKYLSDREQEGLASALSQHSR